MLLGKSKTCTKRTQVSFNLISIHLYHSTDAVMIAGENLNILTVILRSGEEPFLTRPQLQRVLRAHRAHAVYLKHRESLDDSDDDDGPDDDDAWLFEDLKVLTQLYSRLRDREQLIALIFEVSFFKNNVLMLTPLMLCKGCHCRVT